MPNILWPPVSGRRARLPEGIAPDLSFDDLAACGCADDRCRLSIRSLSERTVGLPDCECRRLSFASSGDVDTSTLSGPSLAADMSMDNAPSSGSELDRAGLILGPTRPLSAFHPEEACPVDRPGPRYVLLLLGRGLARLKQIYRNRTRRFSRDVTSACTISSTDVSVAVAGSATGAIGSGPGRPRDRRISKGFRAFLFTAVLLSLVLARQ